MFLEIDHLSVTFRARGRSAPVHAVKDVSLAVERGEILGIVGESGCGKSTLSRCVMQLLKPTAGNITLEGENLTALSSHEIRRRRPDFQMIFQDPYASLNPRLNIFSTLSEALQVRGKLQKETLAQQVTELMDQVGLASSARSKYPHEFSGGQRQRIAIARALATRPKLIIADEPVSALDVSIQSQILNLLSELQKEHQLTMLFISHDLSVVHYLADRIAVMKSGQIVECDAAANVFHSPQHPYTQTLLSAVPKMKLS